MASLDMEQPVQKTQAAVEETPGKPERANETDLSARPGPTTGTGTGGNGSPGTVARRASDGILVPLLLGPSSAAKLPEPVTSRVEPATAQIIEKYRELIGGFPAGRLEALGEIPEALWRGLKEIGVFGLNIPERFGGKGLSTAQYLQVIRAMAGTDMALAIVPTAHLSIGVKAILLFGNEEQKRRYLRPAATGEMVFAYALTEPLIGSDAQHIETTARLSDDGKNYVLNGTKTYITNGGYAGGLTVFAQLDPERPGNLGAFIVETAWEGVHVGPPMPKMGLKVSSTTSIRFENVSVPAVNRIGKPGDGFRIAMAVLNYGRLGLGAASTGAMEQSLIDMKDRAAKRVQFGRPIASFELIQEKIARAYAHASVTEAMTWLTAELLDRDPRAPLAMESSHCKLFGTTRAWDVLYDALQVAGGAGYLATQPYEKRMRDFRVTTVFEGTTEIHSIYPALFLLRQLSRDRKTGRRSRFRGLLSLIRGALTGPGRLRVEEKDRIIHDAARLVRESLKTIRRHLLLGLLRYRRHFPEKEYTLRRMTHVSLHAFGLLALLGDIRARRVSGQDTADRVLVLEVFLDDARKALEELRDPKNRQRDRRFGKLFRATGTEDRGNSGRKPKPED